MTTGTIQSLWRFPVKSFGGEKLDQVHITQNGVLGDRAYALIDKESGKVVSAKSVKLYPAILDCHAAYLQPPQPGQNLPPIQIKLPNGTSVTNNSPDIDRILSIFFGREVTLSAAAPDDYTIDMYHPDLENVDASGHRDTFVEQKLGSALFKELGAESPLAPGSFMDVFPISVITTSTLSQLQELQPETNFDVRRFRMNMVVKTKESGFIENLWVGHGINVGDNVRLMTTMSDSRCVMITLAQDGLAKDNNVLRTLVNHNRLDLLGARKFPCAGVYSTVLTVGSVAINDKVEIV